MSYDCPAEFVLCSLEAPGLSKDNVIQCHVGQYSFVSPNQTSGHTKSWAVSLVIAADHLIFLRCLCGCVWVNIFTLAPPRVLSSRMNLVTDNTLSVLRNNYGSIERVNQHLYGKTVCIAAAQITQTSQHWPSVSQNDLI